MRLLAWHYEKNAMMMPPPSELSQQAERLVNDAHHIARERGRNVVSIIKDLFGPLITKELRYFKGLSGSGIFNRNSPGNISWHIWCNPQVLLV